VKIVAKIWLPLIIFAYLIPFVFATSSLIGGEQLGTFRFYLLGAFFVTGIAGFLLTWLTVKSSRNKETTESFKSSVSLTLLMFSTLIAVLSIIYLPNVSSLLTLIAFAISYAIIFFGWLNYSNLLTNYNNAPEFRDYISFFRWYRSYLEDYLEVDFFNLIGNRREITKLILKDFISVILILVRLLLLLPWIFISFVNPTSIVFLSVMKSVVEDLKRKRSIEIPNKEAHREPATVNNFSVVFGAIFAIIAGLAITQSLGLFNETLNEIDDFGSTATTKLNSTKALQDNFELEKSNLSLHGLKLKFINTLVLISFFIIAIPFYHTAVTFLSVKPLIFSKGREQGASIFHFIILLVEVSILFLMAANVDILEIIPSDSTNPSLEEKSTFIILTIVMISIESMWTLIDILLKNKEIPQEWIYINLNTILFLFCVLAYTNNAIFNISYTKFDEYINEYFMVYTTLIVVLFLRTILNYYAGWNNIYRYLLKSF
jgi:hypothetical protein